MRTNAHKTYEEEKPRKWFNSNSVWFDAIHRSIRSEWTERHQINSSSHRKWRRKSNMNRYIALLSQTFSVVYIPIWAEKVPIRCHYCFNAFMDTDTMMQRRCKQKRVEENCMKMHRPFIAIWNVSFSRNEAKSDTPTTPTKKKRESSKKSWQRVCLRVCVCVFRSSVEYSFIHTHTHTNIYLVFVLFGLSWLYAFFFLFTCNPIYVYVKFCHLQSAFASAAFWGWAYRRQYFPHTVWIQCNLCPWIRCIFLCIV